MIIHGHNKGKKATRTYRIWNNMKNRCNRPTSDNYAYYGGKGVRVCDSWNSFVNFLADMGEAPEDMTLDRINSNGNYEPGNCRWADMRSQSNNRKDNRMLSIGGVSMTMANACRLHNIKIGTVWRRLQIGWSEEDAVLLPVVIGRRHKFAR